MQKKKRSSEKDVDKDSIAESDNPFEEIATRPPPRDWMSMRQLRNNNRMSKRKRRRYRKNGFLTRDDIIKSSSKSDSEAPSVKLVNRDREKAEFDEKKRNIPQETWERENKAAEKVREEMLNGKKEEKKEPISPAMEMLAKENSDLDRRISIAEQSGSRKVDRLPNNPYSNVDFSKPTVISLPLPPLDSLLENVEGEKL
uniref:Uncharacterized protein n=1 Tax=Caenorhabditis japonica TaxID=281687 RepID=A0A8R1E0T9_CAEJA